MRLQDRDPVAALSGPGLRVRALIVAAGCFALPFPAIAGNVYPPNCTSPAMVTLVGHDGAGVSDPIADVSVIVRDLAQNLIANSTVELRFAGFTDLKIAQFPALPGLSVHCETSSVFGFTDAAGRVNFRVMGRTDPSIAAQGAQGPTLEIYADGRFLSRVPVAVLDRDGNGMGTTDLSAWLADYFSNQYWARSDMDGDLALSAGDLSVWLAGFFAAGSVQSSAALCP
ncbi:MAG: hypothetical protein ABIS67_00520 [Candidatus Eisenbacteria bacterium]